MLRLAKVGPNDFVVDLGSGDGRIVIAAAKRYGARGLGVDIDGALVSESMREAQRQGVGDKVAFHASDLFITDISRASVVTMYLYPQVMMRLRPRLIAELKPGARVVSHEFDMDNWQPDDKVTVPVPDKRYGPPRSDVFLWVIPANAAGTWRGKVGAGAAQRDCEVALEQRFQALQGRASAGAQPATIEKGRMRGDAIEFVATLRVEGRDIRHEFSGHVAGDALTGTVVVHAAPPQKLEWSATRVTRGKIDVEASAPLPVRKSFLAQER
jgi:SAM-dependent methyltransferase